MARNTPHDYQKNISHRVRITISVVVEVEVKDANSDAKAMVAALELITNKLGAVPINDRYSWDGAWVDNIVYGDIKHTSLPLKAVPAPEPEEAEVAE